MKKFEDITTYSKVDEHEEFDPEYSLTDQNAQQLEEKGYKVIPVGRAQVIIEQCEDTDVFPEGWCRNPLKLTIFPDLDLDNHVSELYIHGGRYGLMEVIVKRGEQIEMAEFFDATVLRKASLSSKARIQVWLEHIEHDLLLSKGAYWAHTHDTIGSKHVKHDEQLHHSISIIKQEFANMLKRLEELPDYTETWGEQNKARDVSPLANVLIERRENPITLQEWGQLINEDDELNSIEQVEGKHPQTGECMVVKVHGAQWFSTTSNCVFTFFYRENGQIISEWCDTETFIKGKRIAAVLGATCVREID